MTDHVLLVRWAEIYLKGRNRPRFESRLAQQATRLLKPVEGASARRTHGRLIVDLPAAEAAPLAISRLGHLFGMASMSLARRCARELDVIGAVAVELMQEALARRPAGARPTFKVMSRRQDKAFPHDSVAISRHAGAAVVRALGLPVDVHAPEIVIGVELNRSVAMVYADAIPGPGGLPSGTSGKAHLLISGGIDSPVAGWLSMKRGCHLTATYFHAFPYTGDATKEKVISLCAKLAPWQGKLALTVIQFAEVQKQLRALSDDLAVVLYRRMMLRAAAILAERERAIALVTGDNLAQVASQTLENMAVIEEAAPLPVLRPLLTYDKSDIVALAQKIGTYDTSILPYDDCCQLFMPANPAIKSRLKDVERCEERLDLQATALALADAAERIVVE
jgi:thiamine biosynthesis protein ThiI